MNQPPKITKENAKQVMMQEIQESGINPQNFVQLGDMAEKAIKQKEFYPMVVDAAIKFGIAEPGDLGGQIDYRNLAILAAFGKVAQEMSGQPGMMQ